MTLFPSDSVIVPPWDAWMNCETELTPVDAAGTVTVTVPATEPEVAVIVLLPADAPVTRPEALTVATAALEELQLTKLVKFWMLLLL